MVRSIEYMHSAVKDMRKLDKVVAERIMAKRLEDYDDLLALRAAKKSSAGKRGMFADELRDSLGLVAASR